MVELNTTIFPLLGPIGTFVNTIKVLLGGVFGVYLIMLYLRWREYIVMKQMLTEIRKDLRVIAAHDKIDLEPIKQHKLVELGKHIKKIWKQKKKEKEARADNKK